MFIVCMLMWDARPARHGVGVFWSCHSTGVSQVVMVERHLIAKQLRGVGAIQAMTLSVSMRWLQDSRSCAILQDVDDRQEPICLSGKSDVCQSEV
jgi:hypothetical protein